jgi:SAM-dependent methyltransferase
MKYFRNMLNKLKKSLPISLKWKLKKIKYFGKKHYCNVCNSNINRFLSGGSDEPVIEKLKIIGSGYHEYDYCPICKASYRQRLVKVYFDEYHILNQYIKILHVAPEESFFQILKKGYKNYICGDLEPERYNYYADPVKLNLTSLQFADNSFDLILCNHVLEHIPDDAKAMQELYRVLTAGGLAILQVPISLKLTETFEDCNIATPEERLEKFGQKDHVRIYAMDYIERLREAGFSIEIKTAMDFSYLSFFKQLELDINENLFICRK